VKVCSRCKRSRLSGEFYSKKSSPDGKSSYCKACNKEYGRQRYLRNRNTALADAKRNYLENREARLQYKRAYYQANCAEVTARNIRWRDAELRRQVAVITVQSCHRRGKELGSEGRLTYKQVQARLDYFGWSCKDCSADLVDGGEWVGQVHHQIPLGKKGPNWASNLVPLCLDCHYERHR